MPSRMKKGGPFGSPSPSTSIPHRAQPPWRWLRKTMCFPSGDQSGCLSSVGPSVRDSCNFPSVLMRERFLDPLSPSQNTIYLPSGEALPLISSGSLRKGRKFPSRTETSPRFSPSPLDKPHRMASPVGSHCLGIIHSPFAQTYRVRCFPSKVVILSSCPKAPASHRRWGR